MSDIPTRKRKRSVPSQLRGPAFARKQEEVQEKRKEALALRRAGATYQQIADKMGLSTPMQAHRYVNDALAAIPMANAIALKQLALTKLDAQEVRMNQAQKNAKTVLEACRVELTLVKLAERRAKLEGTDAPVRNEHTGANGGAILTGHVDLEGLTDEQLERFKRDPAAFLSTMASGRDSRAEEETSSEVDEARRTH